MTTESERLADAIMRMAEEDKGLVLSKLVEAIDASYDRTNEAWVKAVEALAQKTIYPPAVVSASSNADALFSEHKLADYSINPFISSCVVEDALLEMTGRDCSVMITYRDDASCSVAVWARSRERKLLCDIDYPADAPRLPTHVEVADLIARKLKE